MLEDQKLAIHALLDRQRAFFDGGHTRSLATRKTALQKLESVLTEEREDLLTALSKDLGKPEIEAFLAEYYFLLQEVRLVRKSLKRLLKPRRAKGPFYFWPCRNFVKREPYGTSLIVAPWNYPIQLALSPLISAVAAGNTVILKPSELAPASEKWLKHLVSQCFSENHVSVVTGGVETTQDLLDQRFDFLFFTGSTKVGRIVAQKAAANLSPNVLELGGKCPCVVDQTVDLPHTVRRILIGKLFNAGQTCFAPDFVALHESVKEAFVAELTHCLENAPWEKEMAKIINEKHFQRLTNLLSGRVISKGEDDLESLHLAPRILPDATWDDPAMQEEVFGPILPIVTFADSKQLIDKLRCLSAPLSLYCFSRDEAFFQSLIDAIPSGSVCLNDVGKQACNLDLPFGGVGESGYGRYRGKRGVETFTYERSITKRYFVRDPFEAIPPREKRTRSLKKWLR